MRKVLENIKVFDGLYKLTGEKGYPFITCGEMIKLSIMQYYGINIMPLMSESNFLYKFLEDYEKGILSFGISTPKLCDSFNLEKSVGIGCNSFSPKADDMMGVLAERIKNDYPVDLVIDLYYQKGRDFYYQNEHGGHSLLVYGFDDEKKEIYVIDNVRGYDYYVLSYKDAMELCKNIFDLGDYIKQWGYIRAFCRTDNIDTYSSSFTCHIIDMFKNGMLQQKESRLESIGLIQKLRERYDEFMLHREFTTNINSILYKKWSENCRMKFLYKYIGYSNEQQKYLDEVINKVIHTWKDIYILLNYKIIRNNALHNYEAEKNLLDSIFDLECTYTTKLVEFL